jgi:hypothetical protein
VLFQLRVGLRKVAASAKEAIGNAWRSSGSTRNLNEASIVVCDIQNRG